MRRPNPWVLVPSMVAGLIAGFVGFAVTRVSCLANGASCPVLITVVVVLSFVSATVGMAVVLVLVYRSLAEYREALSRDEEPPAV